MTEEKEAIEIIKSIININKENERTTAMLYVSDVDILLNLIEKLQNENERQQDIIIEKDRQLHLMHKEIQSVREQVWEITDKSLKDILMLNTPKIIIESKEDIKGLLDNYIPKDKIRELLENNYDISTENSRSISVEGAFAFVDDIEELLEEGKNEKD